jgi:aminoglycoside phosphotransferase family enzyme/predicted kinase
VEHPELVSALSRAASYGPEVERVETVQTHVSSVFLTGERVYKLKKPVNFGFLDFSTVELRQRYCRREVELNRRLAPDMYLGVEAVVRSPAGIRIGGDGEVVDWVVVMRQLDQELLGPRVLARGELTAERLEAVVDQLVPFYQRARTGEGVDEFGEVEAIRFNTDENFNQTEEYVGKLLSRERFEHIREWTDAFYVDHESLFRRRIHNGRIRDSHGDLHLGNIFFTDPPTIFDCIELNERFRCGDVAVDLAFLAMDLDFHGRPELSTRLVDRYVELSGDVDLLDLLDFYKAYRAYVRGKISCFTQSDPHLDADVRRLHRNLARRYFGLAYRYTGGVARPAIVVLYGLMGSGKTSLGRYLRERLGWHLLSTDAVRKQLAGVSADTRVWVPYNEGLYSPDMNVRTYAEVCRRAENLLAAGFPVVVDGAFKTRGDRDPVIELARRTGARLLFVETWCGPDEQRRRLEKRQQHDTRSDGRVELMDRQRRDFEGPDPERSHLFARLSTDGAKDDTRRLLLDLLTARDIVDSVDVHEPG